VPLRLRWGLYIGDNLYPDARRAYSSASVSFLFAYTQGKLLDGLRTVPDSPGANDDGSYEKTYNELKAYLITTSNNDKSTRDFLSLCSPVTGPRAETSMPTVPRSPGPSSISTARNSRRESVPFKQ